MISSAIIQKLPVVGAGLLSFVLLAACQSVDGNWSMACQAFAGDRLSFANGRYTWDKFTDARRVDQQGRVIDPFPGFPKTGPYTLDGGVIVLLDGEGGSEAARFYLHRREGAVWLLSAAEHESVSGGGPFPDCPLQRSKGE